MCLDWLSAPSIVSPSRVRLSRMLTALEQKSVLQKETWPGSPTTPPCCGLKINPTSRKQRRNTPMRMTKRFAYYTAPLIGLMLVCPQRVTAVTNAMIYITTRAAQDTANGSEYY